MSSSAAQLPAAAKQAIDWMVRLDSGNACSSERQAFENWLRADAQNSMAWERLQNMLAAPMAQLAGTPDQLPAATEALRHSGLSRQRRKLLRGGSALLVMLGLSSLVAQRQMPLGGLFSDYYSSTGERRRFVLADGSVLTLNARSVVDLRFSGDQRLLRLRQGELQIDVATDPARPFLVETAEGRVRALGTRFTVRQDEGSSLVAVQLHSVEIRTREGQSAVVNDGDGACFSASSVRALSGEAQRMTAWTDGLLEVRDEPLGKVVDALRPYRSGLLRISPEAARLRVFGVFPLDNSELALRSLAEVLPIRVDHYGPMTLIDVR